MFIFVCCIWTDCTSKYPQMLLLSYTFISPENDCHQRCDFWQWFPRSGYFPYRSFLQAANLVDTGRHIATKCLVTTELCWIRCCELEVKALFPITPLSSRRQAKSTECFRMGQQIFLLKIFLRKCGDDTIIFVRTHLVLWELVLSWHCLKLFHEAPIRKVEMNESEE